MLAEYALNPLDVTAPAHTPQQIRLAPRKLLWDETTHARTASKESMKVSMTRIAPNVARGPSTGEPWGWLLPCACRDRSSPRPDPQGGAPENVVRAVGVYEWTGDMAKPTASRLIPVSLFIDGKLEDAGVYLARPVPFALLPAMSMRLTGPALRWARSTWLSRAIWWPPRRRPPPTTTAGSATASSSPRPHRRSRPSSPPRRLGSSMASMTTTVPHFSARSAEPGSGDSATPTPGSSAPYRHSGRRSRSPDAAPLQRIRPDRFVGNSGDTPANDPDRPNPAPPRSSGRR